MLVGELQTNPRKVQGQEGNGEGRLQRVPTAACTRVVAYWEATMRCIRTEEYPELWREWIAMLTIKAGGTASDIAQYRDLWLVPHRQKLVMHMPPPWPTRRVRLCRAAPRGRAGVGRGAPPPRRAAPAAAPAAAIFTLRGGAGGEAGTGQPRASSSLPPEGALAAAAAARRRCLRPRRPAMRSASLASRRIVSTSESERSDVSRNGPERRRRRSGHIHIWSGKRAPAGRGGAGRGGGQGLHA